MTRRIKGKAKQLEGKMTGDKLREAQGAAEKAVGKIGTAARSRVRKAKAHVMRSKVGRKAAAAKSMR